MANKATAAAADAPTEFIVSNVGNELVNAGAALAGLLELVINQTSGEPIDKDGFLALLRSAIERIGIGMEDASLQLGRGPIGYFPSTIYQERNHG